MDNHGGRIEFPKQNKWQHYVDSRRLEITCGEAPRKTNIPAGFLKAAMVFYMTFLFNSCIFDSTFYGLGKTHFMLIQSICIDGIYYGIMFLLYLTGVFVPNLPGICLMFGIGMALDFIPTMILYIRMLKKENLKIDFKLENAPTESTNA